MSKRLLAGVLFITASGMIVSAFVSEKQSSSSAVRTSPVAVGETAPNFLLESQDGQKVSLSEARGKSPVVLVFYRGYW